MIINEAKKPLPERPLEERKAEIHAVSHAITHAKKLERLIGHHSAEIAEGFGGNRLTAEQRDRMAIERAEAEQALWNEANTDPLTGLFNRRYLDIVGNDLLDTARHNGQTVIAGVADVKNLKEANDNLGHNEGDSFLKKTARILERVLPDHIIARIGGDEFAYLKAGRPPFDTGEEAIKEGITKNPDIGEGSKFSRYGVGISVGTSTVGPEETSIFPALERADGQMYADKRKPTFRHRE